MWNNIIGTHIQRTNRNLLFTSAFFLLAVLGLALANARYLENFLTGPYPIAAEKIAATDNPNTLRHYFVRVKGNKSLDTGMTEIEQERAKYTHEVKSERVTAHFMLLGVENKILLVKSDSGEETTEFTGALIPIPEKENSEVVSQIRSGLKEDADALLPYMMDATEFRTEGYIGLAVGIPIVLLSLWGLLQYTRRVQEPGQHPIVRSLKKYGEPTDVAFAIDSDVQMSGATFGPAKIYSNWLLQPKTYGLTLMRLDDLAWVYQKVTKHSVNFIPTGKSYAAILCDRYGARLEVQANQTQALALLNQLVNRNPWMMVGYDAAREKAWTQDRAAVLAAIDARRSGPVVPPM